MNDEERNLHFRQMADTFIAQANDHCETYENGMVSSSFLYGASRFCAFVAASRCESSEQFKSSQAAAIDYFTNEFKTMLEQNLSSYESVYDDAPKYEHLMKGD